MKAPKKSSGPLGLPLLKLPKALRDVIHNARTSVRDFEKRMKEAQVEPTGSNTRRNRLIDAEQQACAVLAYGRMAYRTVEHALSCDVPHHPKPIALPGFESETIRGAVRDLAAIIKDLDEGWTDLAKSDAEKLRDRLALVFEIPK